MRTVLVNSPAKVVREKSYDMPDYPNPSLAILAAYLKSKGEECAVIEGKLERLSLAIYKICILHTVSNPVVNF